MSAQPFTHTYEPTEFGNAQRFVHRYGQRLRYVHEWRRWLVWQGSHWDADERAQVQVRRWAWEAVRTIRAEEVRHAGTAEEAEALVKWSSRSETERAKAAMVALAADAPGLDVTPEQLDRDPWLLPCKNGTVDLRRGELRDSDPGDLLTKRLDLEYHPDAKAPRWDAFLERVQPDPETRAFLQRAAGYTLTGSISEQKLFILYGTGSNGKSVFLDALAHVVGDYARSASSSTILNRRDGQHTEDLARLQGARLVTSIEVEAERRMTEALVKAVTGGDPITARFMRANSFEFVPQFKLWLAVNHPPVVGSGDHGIWRRLVTVPFSVKILDDDEKDKHLSSKLHAEAEGILAWLVRGCAAWQRQGLDEPQSVVDAAMVYRESMDDIQRFLEDATERATDGQETIDDLYEAACFWYPREGLKTPSKPVFGRQLTERDIGQARPRVKGRMTTFRTGIRLVGDYAARRNFVR